MLAKVDENFYKEITSKQEFRNFIDEFVKKFCNENNLKSTQIKTDKFSDYSMYYNPEQNLVYISDFYFDKFETFAKDKNFYFLQNFFNNLVHELRHKQ